ncbi:hypothetical protein Zm00014a_041586 [Zea mays]|uniref:Uncharacterized protein n=1 Tax=Zea mays TaxID=4577 RepID=A0A3L6DYP0_MAIZE|nr:hypothetical protein Zm00014a_041586 [Zea mays]
MNLSLMLNSVGFYQGQDLTDTNVEDSANGFICACVVVFYTSLSRIEKAEFLRGQNWSVTPTRSRASPSSSQPPGPILGEGSNNIGFVVNLVRLNSLTEFGTPPVHRGQTSASREEKGCSQWERDQGVGCHVSQFVAMFLTIIIIRNLLSRTQNLSIFGRMSLLDKMPNIKGFGWNVFTLRILMGNIYGRS